MYTVIAGERTYLNLSSIPQLTPRQIRVLSSSAASQEVSKVDSNLDEVTHMMPAHLQEADVSDVPCALANHVLTLISPMEIMGCVHTVMHGTPGDTAVTSVKQP